MSAPASAMILAAGLATRMRPLTDHTAKPLLMLSGRSLLDHALERLHAAGVERAVVNAHWQAEQVEAHLARRAGAPPRTTVLREETLLETGGGVRAALPELGPDPFFVVNGDAYWLDGPRSALARLTDAMDDEFDGVVLVNRTFQVHADVGMGDFHVDKWGSMRRRREREVAAYVYAGVQLIRPRLLDGMPDGAFSMNLAWDRAIEAGRLRAVVHDGVWFHLSAPSDLADAEHLLQARWTAETW